MELILKSKVFVVFWVQFQQTSDSLVCIVLPILIFRIIVFYNRSYVSLV